MTNLAFWNGRTELVINHCGSQLRVLYIKLISGETTLSYYFFINAVFINRRQKIQSITTYSKLKTSLIESYQVKNVAV